MLALGKRLLLLFCHTGLSIMVACFIKVIKEESISKMEIIILCNLIKEVIFYHFTTFYFLETSC